MERNVKVGIITSLLLGTMLQSCMISAQTHLSVTSDAATATSTTANIVTATASAYTKQTTTKGNSTTNTTEDPTFSTAQVITCETNPCTRPGTWCKKVDGGRECPCKPGYYASDSTCNPGLIFGGELFLANSTTKETVEIFLESAYKDSIGLIQVKVEEKILLKLIDDESWKYTLFYSTNSGATPDAISDSFAYHLWSQPGCDADSEICDVDISNGKTIVVYEEKSVDKAGTLSETVCSSVDEYCDTTSTTCQGINGIATCECMEGYVQKSGADGFCAEIICRQDSDCNTPFGSCNKTFNGEAGKCSCMFGFDGKHCYTPWLFVLIFVAGVLLLTTAILIGLLISRCNAAERKTGLKTKNSFKDLYNTEY